MRLWSLHPKLLDAKGLVALWRESLLAQAVLAGKTKGYKNHPQLERFKATKNPLATIGFYLLQIHNEAESRGYNFNTNKILINNTTNKKLTKTISVTSGQVKYEWQHLMQKLQTRTPEIYNELKTRKIIPIHPLFRKIPGKIEKWEKHLQNFR